VNWVLKKPFLFHRNYSFACIDHSSTKMFSKYEQMSYLKINIKRQNKTIGLNMKIHETNTNITSTGL